jgi:hypothetical protein
MEIQEFEPDVSLEWKQPSNSSDSSSFVILNKKTR